MPTALTVIETTDSTCCSPITSGVMSDDEATSLAIKFKAMSDPTRLKLLSLVAATQDGEACVCDLNEPLDLSQPTVSHHLKILVEAGLLTRAKRGRWAYFALVPGALPSLADTLQA
ncbi:ArsR family transcriptional regulator [Aeromicrobium panaciterrae]|uniref:ArsR family transcriptional regulator n=1 Tax=Aeromicrobium panaciterrae TaxID=363861 RepID=A0ABU1UL67_9ACTN|nr:metalloregulator ArsR/SmtB family transcription factor [Aeromicrobium panaciterrae]MDR7085903.1 ArsR family transcriptional regulator [Aeromicrobium panaciterrae]